MSRWTHSFCDNCYAEAAPGRQPTRFIEDGPVACCKCGKMHESGIYYRCDPETLLCKGKHD